MIFCPDGLSIIDSAMIASPRLSSITDHDGPARAILLAGTSYGG